MQNDQVPSVAPEPVDPVPVSPEPVGTPIPMTETPVHASPPPLDAPITSPPPTASLPTTKKRSMLPLIMIVVVILVIATAITGYLLSQRKPLEKVVSALPLPTQSPVINQAPAVLEGYKAYTDTTYGLKFLYPADATFTAQEAAGSYLVSKVGSDQLPNTELTDGLSVEVMVSPLANSLQEVVAADKVKIVNPEVGTAGETTLYSIGSLSGYTFTYTSLGSASYYYFPLGTDYYVRVADASVDPGTKGYKELVNTILQSIEYVPTKPLDGSM